MSGIVTNVSARDRRGQDILRSLEASDQRLTVIEQGVGSAQFEVVIVSPEITPGSGQAPRELARLLDQLEPGWRGHLDVAGSQDGHAG